MHRSPLEDVLSGRKTIESRFARVRCPPFGKVRTGDRLLLKQAAGPVRGEATAGKVLSFEGLTPVKVKELFRKYPGIRAGKEFMNAKNDSKYATLIFLENMKKVEPYAIKKRDRRPWVILD